MSVIARMYVSILNEEITKLQRALHDIAVHIGGSPGLPETVIEAAESARAALNRHLGHADIPRDTDGQPVPFAMVGR